MDDKHLPAPRIELRWRRTNEIKFNWCCDYFLILALKKEDIRVDQSKPNPLEYWVKIGEGTRVSCVHPVSCGRVDTPFRDGAHAKWDSDQLGRIPIYAVCENIATNVRGD